MLYANVGDVIKVFTYRGHTSTIDVGIVEDVTDIHKSPLSVETYKQNVINRSQFLLTIRSTDEKGRPVYRNYYHEFILGKKLNWFCQLVARFKGKI